MITAIGDVMRECYKRGWITTRDGNCSLRRRNSKCVYITPSGVRKNIIHPEFLIKMIIQPDGSLEIPNGSKPSGELHMHQLLQINAPSTRAVIHVHPTHTIAAMLAGWDLRKISEMLPELSRYTRVGPNVPVLPVTSTILGEATATALKNGITDFDIVGQAGHGVCSVASDPWAAFEHIERLNHSCEMVLLSGIKP